MKTALHLIATLFLLSLVSASAQTPPAPANAPASATAAEDSTTPAMNVRYKGKPGPWKAFQARMAAIRGKPCDIIFIGDSITDRWLASPGKAVWDKYYAPRNTLNFGVFADTTQNVLWRFDNVDLTGLHPKVAVILIGTNNTKDDPQQIADGVKAVIGRTQTAFPGVKIILVSIMPNQRAEDKMMATDAIIKNFADNQSVYWLDLVPLMPPVTTTKPDGTVDNSWKGLGTDHLHPDTSGYQIWADAMEPLLDRLLAGNAK
jgi:lysophospholipase L1-like esterase